MNNYLFLDTELGGLLPGNSLLEVGLIKTDSKFNVVENICIKTKPKNGVYSVTGEALGINRIDLTKHSKSAYTYEEAGTLLYNVLQKWSDNGRNKLVPVGKNIHTDIYKVWEFLISRTSWENFVSYQWCDISSVLRYLQAVGKIPLMGKTGLVNVAEHFNIIIDNNQLHSSLYDCQLGIEIMKRLVQL